jgi:hypothetical protein
MRTHRSPGQQWEPRVDQSASSDEAIHRALQAVHDYRALMDRVNLESQRILEAICCACYSVVEYEEQRGWRKGYAIIRLREALDEMNEGRRRKRK